MNLTLHRLTLPLAHPFTIARGSISTQRSLVVELECDGISGFGEVTENGYYGHTIESMSNSLQAVRPLLNTYASEPPADVWDAAREAVDDDLFALSALDMAAHDLHGRRRGKPTYQVWGLEWNGDLQSSFTIGIDSIDRMIAKLKEQPGWSIYKIKLGTDRDVQIVEALRRHTDALFRVDANCSWSVEETIANSHALAELDVEFIEQPLAADAPLADRQRIFYESALPLIADENCQVEDDIQRCAGQFHGVNLKLCKCGGLTPALRMLRIARQLELKTMVGCMVESSIGISAAAQLAPLLDFADFDGAVLLKEDPAEGVRIDHGKILLSGKPGTGCRLK